MDRDRAPTRAKAAFPCWDGRIAPVFDTARELHLVEAESGKALSRTDTLLHSGQIGRKAAHLAGLGVGTLVCGAISRPMRELVVSFGIQVVSFVSGERDEVVRAWLQGELGKPAFAMPGCGGRRRSRFRGRFGGGDTAVCLCPGCGHVEPHERGFPCVRQTCPRCGAAMTRGS